MKNVCIAGVFVLMSAASCAKRPDAIVPVDIPQTAYDRLTCPELIQQSTSEQQTLSSLSRQQNDAANGDAVGVFLIGVPLASAGGGDKEGMISTSKGKILAIENAARAKGCKSTYFSDPSLQK